MKTATAADIMTRSVLTVGPDAPLTDVIDVLVRHGVNGVPVVDAGGNLLGMISEYDVVNFALSGEADDTAVREAMTRELVTFAPDTPCATIANCFAQRRFRQVPIVRDGKLMGIVSRRDILRHTLFMYARSEP